MSEKELKLKDALIECLIPLEALFMTSMDSDFLCQTIKDQITKSIKVGRLALFDTVIDDLLEHHKGMWEAIKNA